MIKKFIRACLVVMAAAISFSSCKKAEYSFGDLKVPENLAVTAAIQGQNAANPNGDGTGKVLITITANNALNYKVDFGDGTFKMVPSGVITYRYSTPGTTDFVITINAIGTGGATSTISKQVKVFVNFVIPAAILQNLTDGGSKVWQTDRNAGGHFGVGPNNLFFPLFYSAGPNTREPCAYDDDITFSKDALDRVSLSINNKGESFSIGAATSFYGFAGGDGCYAINTGGTKSLSFSNSTSGSSASESTQIEFVVPGNGIINFGTGGVRYEILSITPTQVHIRNIGADGNSWYQKLIKK